MTEPREPQGGPVAEAIRERIRTLQEELAHWQALLRQCEGDAPAPDEKEDRTARDRGASPRD